MRQFSLTILSVLLLTVPKIGFAADPGDTDKTASCLSEFVPAPPLRSELYPETEGEKNFDLDFDTSYAEYPKYSGLCIRDLVTVSPYFLGEGLKKHFNQKTLIVVLNSHGGWQSTGNGIIQILNELKANGVVVQTHVPEGAVCDSECTAIFSVGTIRTAAPGVTFGFHGGADAGTKIMLTEDQMISQYFQPILENVPTAKDFITSMIHKGVFKTRDVTYVPAAELLTSQYVTQILDDTGFRHRLSELSAAIAN